MRGVFTGILRVNGERGLTGKQKAAGDGGLLIAELTVDRSVLGAGSVEERVEKIPDSGLAARPPGVLHQSIDGDGPAAGRLHGQMYACQAGIAGCKAVAEYDFVGLRHAGEEYFVTQSEPGERLIVRQSDRGHRRSLGAHQHAAVRHRREPMRAVADVQLRPAETQTHHRSAGALLAVVGDDAQIEEQVVARLNVALSRHIPGAVLMHAIPVRDGRACAVGLCEFDAGMGDAVAVHVPGQIPAHLLAQPLIDFAGFGQRCDHGCRGNRASHHRLVGQNEHSVDLALNLRFQVERQVGADAHPERGYGQGAKQAHRCYSQILHGASVTVHFHAASASVASRECEQYRTQCVRGSPGENCAFRCRSLKLAVNFRCSARLEIRFRLSQAPRPSVQSPLRVGRVRGPRGFPRFQRASRSARSGASAPGVPCIFKKGF